MARLIDADALMYSIRHAMYPSDMTTTVAVGICERHVEDAPTVEAIPLEWLRDKMQKPRVTVANPFGYVLAEWLEEQGAR